MILFALISLVLPRTALADDDQLSAGYVYDDEISGNLGDSESNHLFTSVEPAAAAAEETESGRSHSSSSSVLIKGDLTAPYHEITVEVLESQNEESRSVTARITIKNKGQVSDKNVLIEYYIEDGQSRAAGKASYLIKETPPATSGQADCLDAGGKVEAVTGDCIVELEKSVLIPDDAGAGEWRFIVEYQTVSQLTITAYDAFQVKSVESNMPISSEEAGEELPKPKTGKT